MTDSYGLEELEIECVGFSKNMNNKIHYRRAA